MIKRIKAIFLADATPGGTLTRLERSWDIRITFKRLGNHEWNRWDLQYVVMIPLLLFCFCVMVEPPLLVRVAIAILLLVGISAPITSQFWLPFMPIATWLILFYSCRFIPAQWRPSIFVRVLPALETIFYGGDLSEVLASFTHPALDLLAWVPYGLVHYGSPFVVGAICFIFGPPCTLPCFAFAFGWANTFGVIIQILFPTAPPWYQRIYGLDPANYAMPGNAGGLARIDQLLGLNLYTGAFKASPLVFGAFPSLHSGFAVMEALFLSHLFPRFTGLFFSYVLWIWWSTMYLTHHYFVDLIGGAALSFSVFYVVKLTRLPRVQRDKFARWSYDYIETGIAKPVKLRKSIDTSSDADEEEAYIELPRLETAFPKTSHHKHTKSASRSATPSPADTVHMRAMSPKTVLDHERKLA